MQGAVTEMSPEQMRKTQYWVPVFGRPKPGSDKIRLITNLRALNACSKTPKHKAETWTNVMSQLQCQQLQWGMVIDLKNYYHNLGVHPATRRWMRVCVAGRGFQMSALPFGWSLSPLWAAKLAKPLQAWLQGHLVPHCWWVDDIAIFGKSKAEVENHVAQFVHLLTSLGMKVNWEKSMPEPAQSFTYLGHCLNLAQDQVSPLPQKARLSLRMVKKQLSGHRIQPRNISSLAGNLLDMVKSNARLRGLPPQLMHQAALAIKKNVEICKLPFHHPKCWLNTQEKTPPCNPSYNSADMPCPIPCR
jgi:hypothetical protein